MTYNTFQLIKDYWIFLEGRRIRFVFFSVLRFLSEFGGFIIAYFLGKSIDFFTAYNTGDSLTTFYFYVSIIAFIGAFHIWLRFYSKLKLQSIGAEVRREVRVRAMEKLMELELKWHESEDTGAKIQKINNGGDMVYEAMHFFSNWGGFITISISGAILFFALSNLWFALYAVVYAFIYLLGEYYFNKKIKKWQIKLDKIKEKVSGKIHESASNVLTVKSLGLHSTFTSANEKHEKDYYDIWLNTKKISQQKGRTIKMYAILGYAGFILILGLAIAKNMMTVGFLLVYTSYFSRLRMGLEWITNNIDHWIRIESGIGRFMTIIGLETFDRNRHGLQNIPKDWRSISIKDLQFAYKDESSLKGVNLKINKNERIGIVGQSGSGKSTLVKLLLGLYTPNKGSIKIGGIEIDKIKQKSLSENVSVVLQESEMFNSSLIENISISSEKFSKKSLERAIKISCLEPLIKKLPSGLSTLIGEKGYRVSGGERQRIGIARALYKDTPILILDEATSHLDTKTEAIIQKNIEKILDRKTLLIIAHRLSTLKNVDRIIVMDNGRIVEQGSFERLIKIKGKFFELYQKS